MRGSVRLFFLAVGRHRGHRDHRMYVTDESYLISPFLEEAWMSLNICSGVMRARAQEVSLGDRLSNCKLMP